MKRENKAYSYKEQIIEMEIQEVISVTLVSRDISGRFQFLFCSAGTEEEERHQRGGAANKQTEGNDASPAGKGGCYSQETSGGMQSNHMVRKKCFHSRL